MQPWFREGANGSYVLVPRIGFKPLFDSERAGIAVRSRDELTDVLNALISATRSGEVDAELSRLAAPVGKKAKKRAA